MKPTVLYRIAFVLLIFLATGHTIAVLKLKPPYLAWYLGGMARHNPQAIGSLRWAFFALQFASIALSAIYFFLPPIVLSTLVAICVGLAAWGIQGAKPWLSPSVQLDQGRISRI
jgi:hypothetical protein